MTTRITYDVAQNDREDLEGKIVDYIYSTGVRDKVKVVGVNRAVGITLVHMKESGAKYAVCIRGPVVPNPSNDFNDYDKVYDCLVSMIEQGSVYVHALCTLAYGPGYKLSSCNGNCAYSQ